MTQIINELRLRAIEEVTYKNMVKEDFEKLFLEKKLVLDKKVVPDEKLIIDWIFEKLIIDWIYEKLLFD